MKNNTEIVEQALYESGRLIYDRGAVAAIAVAALRTAGQLIGPDVAEELDQLRRAFKTVTEYSQNLDRQACEATGIEYDDDPDLASAWGLVWDMHGQLDRLRADNLYLRDELRAATSENTRLRGLVDRVTDAAHAAWSWQYPKTKDFQELLRRTLAADTWRDVELP